LPARRDARAGRTPLRLDGEYTRDEAGQAANLREVLEIFDSEGVDSAFIWLFELCNFPRPATSGDASLLDETTTAQ